MGMNIMIIMTPSRKDDVAPTTVWNRVALWLRRMQFGVHLRKLRSACGVSRVLSASMAPVITMRHSSKVGWLVHKFNSADLVG